MAWDIPYIRNSMFTGHEDFLSQVKESQRIALIGPEGIGKTEIALEYAYRHRDEYTRIFWVTGSDLISRQHRELAAQLRILPRGTRWLLILDHIEDLMVVDRIVPKASNGQIVLTTRIPLVPSHLADRLYITPLSLDEATLLLLRRAGLLPAQALLDQAPISVRRDAVAIAQDLKCNPLALNVAGSTIETTHISLSDYLRQLRREPLPLQRLTSGQLLNQHVVYLEGTVLPHIYVGRVIEVKPFSLEDKTARGLIAQVTLLEANRHEDLVDLFFKSYLFNQGEPGCPASGFFYKWPDHFPPLTFEQLKRPGHYIKIQLTLQV